MVRQAKFGHNDSKHRRPYGHRRGVQLRANLDHAYDPDAATPDEIVEAKLDGLCPRCGGKGDFGDEGLCLKCGFAY